MHINLGEYLALVALLVVTLVVILPNNGFSWMILLLTLLGSCISGLYIVEPNTTGADRKSECQESFRSWGDEWGTWEESTVFRDSDFDGYGKCVTSQRNTKKSDRALKLSPSTTMKLWQCRELDWTDSGLRSFRPPYCIEDDGTYFFFK